MCSTLDLLPQQGHNFKVSGVKLEKHFAGIAKIIKTDCKGKFVTNAALPPPPTKAKKKLLFHHFTENFAIKLKLSRACASCGHFRTIPNHPPTHVPLL